MGSYYLPYNGLQIWVAFVRTGRGVEEEEEEEEGASTGSVSCRSSNLAARRLLDKRVTTHPDRLGNRIQFSTLTKDCCQHRNMAENTKNFLCEDFFKRAKRCQRSALQADNVALRQSFRLRGALCNSRLIRVYCYPFFSKKKKFSSSLSLDTFDTKSSCFIGERVGHVTKLSLCLSSTSICYFVRRLKSLSREVIQECKLGFELPLVE